MSNDQLTFWASTDAWPRDTSTHSFLARATNQLGEALFGNDWNGPFDVTEKLIRAPLSTSDDLEANNVLARYKPELGRKIIRGRGLLDAEELSRDDWRVAQETVRKVNEEKLVAINRFKRVSAEIVNGAESGRLSTATRPLRGGEFSPIPASYWNIDDPSSRFFFCQLNPLFPFGIGVKGDDFCWIFVTRESLESLIARLKNRPQVDPANDRQIDVQIPNDVECYELVSLPGKKQQAVFRALHEAWKDGRIPKLLTISQIQDKIDPIVKRMGDRGGASADNIRRALGLKQ